MKTLSNEELRNLSIAKAEEIVREFGRFMEQGNVKNTYCFGSKLPWRKSDILAAILTLLKHAGNLGDQQSINTLCTALWLLDFFIPDPDEYAMMLKTMEKISKIVEESGL